MMNELAELRMEEYNRLSEKYKKLEAITVELLEENLKNKDLRPMHITHRIKTADSSIGKLERKPDFSLILFIMTYLRKKKQAAITGLTQNCYSL
jgi:ppGpp synthetase/RelA/SpoT-type nucleotidyltranferase